MKKIIPIALLTFALTGCAAIQQDYDQTFCTPDNAYQNGIRDARSGKVMRQNYAASCSANTNHRKINRDYRHGYRFATRRMERRHRR